MTPRTSSRLKPPLTIAQQRLMLNDYTGPPGDFGQALVQFFLSTGCHQCVLHDPEGHSLKVTPDYYSYLRPKTHHPVTFPWSRLMTRTGAWSQIKLNAGATTRWYNDETARIGKEAGLPFRVGPNMLRHNMFINLARLGHDPFYLMHRAGTSLDSIGRYYTVGHTEGSRLSPSDLAWLQELMEP